MKRTRLHKLREFLESKNLDGLIVSHLPNVRYLSGFTGSNGVLIILKETAYFLTDFRYMEQSKEEVSEEFETCIYQDLLKEGASHIKRLKRIAFEGDFLPYNLFKKIKREAKGVKLISVENIVGKIRSRKEHYEIERIKKAVGITDKVFEKVLSIIRPCKMKERELAMEMEYLMKELGASGPSFDTIVASGKNSALPHARAGDDIISSNTMLLLDFGCYYKGYSSDITRTIWIGKKLPKEFINIYNIVKSAQIKAINKAKAGMRSKTLDRTARKIIEDKGFGKNFGHSLGHGVGMEVHELPVISPRAKEKIEEDNVFTVEPGIYIPGYGGVRIEDIVHINNGKAQILTRAPKDLIRI